MRFLVALTILFFASTGAYAQGAAVKSTADAKQPGTSAIAPLSKGKVAVIDSRAFAEGVGEMKRQIDKLEAEFQPRTKELETMQDQLVKLDEEIKNGSNLDPKVLNQKVEQAQVLKREFDRKREDYQADLQKRYQLVLGPVQEKMHKFLEQYAAQREIIVVFDLAPAAQSGLIYLNPASNITEEFIKEYNRQNPVPGAPPQPEPNR